MIKSCLRLAFIGLAAFSSSLLFSCTGDSGDDCLPVTADSVVTVNNGAWLPIAATSSLRKTGTIQFVNDQTGFTLGINSLRTSTIALSNEVESSLQKTTDGGATWFPFQAPLTSVHFIDVSTGLAVGGDGIILKTSNGGAVWTVQSSGVRKNLTSVHMVSTTMGYAAGDSGIILKTTNGGTSWVPQKSGTANYLSKLQFMNANVGIAIGDDGIIVLTSNGGASWKKPVSPTKGDLNAVHFRDASNGWILGQGTGGRDATLLKSSDGGKSWKEYATTIPSSQNLGRISAVQTTGPNTGWALVDNAQSGGYVSTLLKTTNAGATWQVSRQIPEAYAYEGQPGSIFFSDSNNGWYSSGGTILITHNAGQSWSSFSGSAIAGDGGFRPAAVFFANSTTGYVVGAGGTIYKSINGGEGWTRQRGGLPLDTRHFYFSDPTTGWAVGGYGTLAKTTDGGNLWISQFSGVTQTLLATHFVNSQEGYVVGASGVVLKTENGGATWVQKASGTYQTLRSVRFTEASQGYAVGEVGTIIKTTDWGETWATQSSRTNKNLTSIYFTDAINGWAVGGGTGSEPYGDVYDANPYWSRGIILKTSNGGDSWAVEDTTPLKLYSVSFLNPSTGYAVGGGPTYVSFPTITGNYQSYCKDFEAGYYSQILKTTNGGATWVPELIGLQSDLTSPTYLKAGIPFFSVSCGPGGKCATVSAEGVWRRP